MFFFYHQSLQIVSNNTLKQFPASFPRFFRLWKCSHNARGVEDVVMCFISTPNREYPPCNVGPTLQQPPLRMLFADDVVMCSTRRDHAERKLEEWRRAMEER